MIGIRLGVRFRLPLAERAKWIVGAAPGRAFVRRTRAPPIFQAISSPRSSPSATYTCRKLVVYTFAVSLPTIIVSPTSVGTYLTWGKWRRCMMLAWTREGSRQQSTAGPT